MDVSSLDRSELRKVQKELSKVLRETGLPRPQALEAAGLRESAFDSAWSRGSMKLAWILRILRIHGVDPKIFFGRVWGAPDQNPDSPPPMILQIARHRSDRK